MKQVAALPPGEPVFAIEDSIQSQMGSAETSVISDHPVCVLWIPDPEQYHGWREFYVQRAPTKKPGAKRMGYK